MSFLLPSPTGIISKVAQATLPEPIAKLIKDFSDMSDETKILSNRLLSPISGPILPFCIKKSDRILFCAEVTKDIILIAAGGAGLVSLATTIALNPEMIYYFMTEAIIPTINEMYEEGHTVFKENLEKVFQKLLNLNLKEISEMESQEFVDHVAKILDASDSPASDVDEEVEYKQVGGKPFDINSLTMPQIRHLVKTYNL
jgi:hypothetical protein